jgi:maltooligosyltrehalose trehalohydrolase
MTAQWSDDVHHALHAWLTGERQGYYLDFGSGEVLTQTLTRVFRHTGGPSAFRGADWGRPVNPARHPGHRFVAFLQSHDQIGNRARGDRIGHGVSPARLAAGAALVLTSAFTPMLFMGEEWSAGTPWCYFCDFTDPDLAKAVSEGRITEFAAHGWRPAEVPDPQNPATREASVLDWTELDQPDHAAVLRWYTDLIALRRREPDLRADRLAEVRVEAGDHRVLAHRGSLLVAANLEPFPARLDGEPWALDRVQQVLLAWGGVRLDGDRLHLDPDAVAVARGAMQR